MDWSSHSTEGQVPQAGEPAVMVDSIVHPSENDIILGRGTLHAQHPGNIKFYTVIDEHIPAYNAAATRSEKTQIVQKIHDILVSEGRFVKEHPPSSACVVVDADTAKKKISHAIRYRRKPDKVENSLSESTSGVGSPASPQGGGYQSEFLIPPPDARQLYLPPLHLNDEQMQQRQLLNQQLRMLYQQQHVPQSVPHPVASSFRQPTYSQGAATGESTQDSPQSLFSDGELNSVLLPPEEMASLAIFSYEDLHGDFLIAETDGGDGESSVIA